MCERVALVLRLDLIKALPLSWAWDVDDESTGVYFFAGFVNGVAFLRLDELGVFPCAGCGGFVSSVFYRVDSWTLGG